ncbi:MAG: peptidylprolyl isomerase [Thiobacillus sp.]|nr:peptidylprolyl isomerase [Thiobacillus sp.]
MRRILITCLLTLAAVPLVHAAESDVVARMGDITLTLAEARLLAAQGPAEALTPQALERLARTEIIRKSIAAEARRQTFDRKPDVAAQMERAAEQALVTAYMNGIARPPADFPPEDLVRQAYESNKAAFTTAPQFHVSQIYVAGSDASAARKADDLHRQAVKKRADFAAIARKSSDHKPSAEKGGDMGWLSAKDLVPAVRATLEGLKNGEVGKPVQGGEGYHILKLEARKDAEVLPLDKARPILARNLRLAKAQEIEAAYLDALLAKTPVAINGIALSELGKDGKK